MNCGNWIHSRRINIAEDINFFKNIIRKWFVGKMVLMKKEAAEQNKKRERESPSFVPPGSIFTPAQSDKMELGGRRNDAVPPRLPALLSPSPAFSALHYLPLPSLPVMTIFIEFKD